VKRKAARILFFAFVLSLWLAAAVIALELFERLRWEYIHRQNTYIAAYTSSQRFPSETGSHVPPGEAGVPPLLAPLPEDIWETVLEENPEMPRYPEPDPLSELAARLRWFIQLGGEERESFAHTYNLRILLLDQDLQVKEAWRFPHEMQGRQLSDSIGSEKAARIATLAGQLPAAGKPVFIENLDLPLDHEGLPALSRIEDPASGKMYLVLSAGSGYSIFSRPPEGSIWELPFIRYHKHAARPDKAITTNNFGFRGPDIQMPKPAGCYRIVCVGASTTEEGIHNLLTWPAILERKLADYFGTDRFDVVNCGISGMNLKTDRIVLGDHLALDPDMLIYYHGVNDICHQLFPGWVTNGNPVWMPLQLSRFLTTHIFTLALPPTARLKNDIHKHMTGHLRFLSRHIRAAGVDVALCSFARPAIETIRPDELKFYEFLYRRDWGGRYVSFAAYCHVLDIFNRQVKALCEEEDILYIPLAENIRGGVYYFGDICHMKNPAIELKADLVLRALEPRLRAWLEAQPPRAPEEGLAASAPAENAEAVEPAEMNQIP
jgi:hypothetical protein